MYNEIFLLAKYFLNHTYSINLGLKFTGTLLSFFLVTLVLNLLISVVCEFHNLKKNNNTTIT